MGQKFNPLFWSDISDSLSLAEEMSKIVSDVFILFLTAFDVTLILLFGFFCESAPLVSKKICKLNQENNYWNDEYLHKHFKLKVIELEEEIAIHKDKLRNICGRERLAFLLSKLKQFKAKLYKDLEKKKYKKLTKLTPSPSEIPITQKQWIISEECRENVLDTVSLPKLNENQTLKYEGAITESELAKVNLKIDDSSVFCSYSGLPFYIYPSQQ